MRRVCLLVLLVVFSIVAATVDVRAKMPQPQAPLSSEELRLSFRRELYSHMVVAGADWPDPKDPAVLQGNNGTCTIVVKMEEEKRATFYCQTNFHVVAPDFKSVPAKINVRVRILLVDERRILRRFAFPAKIADFESGSDRLLLQFSIPKDPADLGAAFLRQLEESGFPTTYDYNFIVQNLTPANKFADLPIPPPQGTPLWLAGFALGLAPRMIELAMGFEEHPGKSQFRVQELDLPRIWFMEVPAGGSVGGMSGGFVYNARGEVVALHHASFSFQGVVIYTATTPGPDLKAWLVKALARLGVEL